MKTIYLAFLIPLLSTATYAQDVSLEWAKSMGGVYDDHGNSLSTDTSGNVYITGVFSGTADLDPGAATFNLISNGSYDVFIQKLDAGGNLIWAKSIGGTHVDEGHSIANDDAGNVYITGRYHDTVDFDPGTASFNLISGGGSDIFVLKLSTNGNFLWAKSMEGVGLHSNYGYSITTDTSENVYITGVYSGTVDFNPGVATFNLISNGADDVFVQKLDANGNFIWAKSMGGTGNDGGIPFITNTFGNLLIAGLFKNTVDFDPGTATFNLTSNGTWDVFIQKLDTDGNFIWAKSIGSASHEAYCSIALDGSGNIYVTGNYSDTMDSDPGAATFNLISNGFYDIFILKLDTDGNFIWAKSIGGMHPDLNPSITTDTSGNVFVIGNYMGTIDFDPNVGTFNLTSQGYYDFFIEMLDSSGNFIWVKSIGSTNDDRGLSITTSITGNLYVTGHYFETVDFDAGVVAYNLTSNGGQDIFIQKFVPCYPISGIEDITACDSITWIDGNTYTVSNTTATHTLVNAAGCDSIVTLNLTINTVDINVTAMDPVITANAAGASYQWLDCNNNFAVVIGETAQTFTATANGDYAVEITQNGCTDTTACVNISSLGINKNTLFKNLSISPNPTQGRVKIGLGNLGDVAIKIFNIDGQLVYHVTNINTSTHQFELNGAAGVYFVEVYSQGETEQLKIVKN